MILEVAIACGSKCGSNWSFPAYGTNIRMSLQSLRPSSVRKIVCTSANFQRAFICPLVNGNHSIMAKREEGSFKERDGKLYAVVTWVDSGGKRHWKERRVRNKTEGNAVIKKMYQELEEHGGESLQADSKTFHNLAAHLEENYLIPPEYVKGRKVAGKRSYKDDLGILKILCEYFGRTPLREITWGKIEKFRVARIKTPTHRGEQRSIARVNRELSLLRHALKIAIGEGWLHKNPFANVCWKELKKLVCSKPVKDCVVILNL
jgi:hypothetical protein